MVVGERFEIGYMLDNLKDITTKVISTQSQFLFDTVIRNLDSFKAVLISDVDTKTPNVNQFVTKEKPIQASAISPDTLTMGEAMYLLGDNHPLFMMTAIKYENLVTKEPVFGFIALKLTWHRNGRGLTEVVRNDVD
jgi:hypothetical protein